MSTPLSGVPDQFPTKRKERENKKKKEAERNRVDEISKYCAPTTTKKGKKELLGNDGACDAHVELSNFCELEEVFENPQNLHDLGTRSGAMFRGFAVFFAAMLFSRGSGVPGRFRKLHWSCYTSGSS